MYFKGTKKECDQYNEKVTKGEKFHLDGQIYDKPIKIQGNYYILKHSKYYSDMEEVEKLPKKFDPLMNRYEN